MNTKDTHRRRGRPPLLTTEQIIDGAMAVADRDGLSGLSMPALASELGVGTMTLYGYVTDKQELLDLMAARIFEGLAIPEDADWRAQLGEYFREFRHAALRHPALAQLLASGRLTIPAVFDTLERAISTMRSGGLDAERATRTFYTALTYTLGFVLWEIPRAHLQPESDYQSQWRELLGSLDPARYPTLTGDVAEVATTTASIAQFEWGLGAILGAAGK